MTDLHFIIAAESLSTSLGERDEPCRQRRAQHQSIYCIAVAKTIKAICVVTFLESDNLTVLPLPS